MISNRCKAGWKLVFLPKHFHRCPFHFHSRRGHSQKPLCYQVSCETFCRNVGRSEGVLWENEWAVRIIQQIIHVKVVKAWFVTRWKTVLTSFPMSVNDATAASGKSFSLFPIAWRLSCLAGVKVAEPGDWGWIGEACTTGAVDFSGFFWWGEFW